MPYSPVTVAIWDSGIDASLFPGRMWTEANDGNATQPGGSGASHGIAFDASGKRTPDLMRPLTSEERQNSELLSALFAGQMEIFANPDSPNAKRFREVMKDTPAERLPHLLDEIEDYRGASHGTMCAFMASADNPYIRLMSARTMGDESWTAKLTHQPPSIPQAQIVATTFMNLIQFFREHNVKVVNISWGMEPHEFDEAAEKYGNDPDVSRRHQTARAAFEIERQGLYAAMSSAPSVLFVAASGNSDEDVAEAEIAPQSFKLPNLIKVGAVDPAGIAAGFTTFGTEVDVYGVGFQRVPLLGGRLCPTVGTSLAAPSVVNLAAKILAVNPSLDPTQVIDLIRRGASRNEESLLVINPKRSMELLNERKERTGFSN
jgi:subtilisin family serine protease